VRVLVVGSGGREHALVRSLARGAAGVEVLAAPGNVGMARDGVRCLPVPVADLDALVGAAVEHGVSLVAVGPEAPLVGGLVDMLGAARIRAFGPSAAAAHIEGSKGYAKEVMEAAGVPTARSVLAHNRADAEAALAGHSYPVVLKADTLAAGKGVIICADEAEARAALDAYFGERRFGHTPVLVEEFLEGSELSLLSLCDGVRAIAMAPARDYKRIFDGDRGPNTGGMGSFSPVPDADDPESLNAAIHQPIVDELRRRGAPFHGVLYAGLMMTADGARVLEFNCRFGDPETQAILPRLRSDLLDLLERSARPGGLDGARVKWSDDCAVTVVLASRGYPESSSKGDAIAGLDEAAATGAEVLHAGTAERDGEIVTAGGRVLNVTGLGATLGEARERAYAAADMIEFDGKQLRRDIAATTNRLADDSLRVGRSEAGE
jgi:phosphoribosylamine---glycine ligase